MILNQIKDLLIINGEHYLSNNLNANHRLTFFLFLRAHIDKIESNNYLALEILKTSINLCLKSNDISQKLRLGWILLSLDRLGLFDSKEMLNLIFNYTKDKHTLDRANLLDTASLIQAFAFQLEYEIIDHDRKNLRHQLLEITQILLNSNLSNKELISLSSIIQLFKQRVKRQSLKNFLEHICFVKGLKSAEDIIATIDRKKTNYLINETSKNHNIDEFYVKTRWFYEAMVFDKSDIGIKKEIIKDNKENLKILADKFVIDPWNRKERLELITEITNRTLLLCHEGKKWRGFFALSSILENINR